MGDSLEKHDTCICGHEKRNHLNDGMFQYCIYGWDWEKKTLERSLCKCLRFKLDNLTYVEKEAKRKHLI